LWAFFRDDMCTQTCLSVKYSSAFLSEYHIKLVHGIAEIDFVLFSTITCPNWVFLVILNTQRAKDSKKETLQDLLKRFESLVKDSSVLALPQISPKESSLRVTSHWLVSPLSSLVGPGRVLLHVSLEVVLVVCVGASLCAASKSLSITARCTWTSCFLTRLSWRSRSRLVPDGGRILVGASEIVLVIVASESRDSRLATEMQLLLLWVLVLFGEHGCGAARESSDENHGKKHTQK
jgi:hypothetical protein